VDFIGKVAADSGMMEEKPTSLLGWFGRMNMSEIPEPTAPNGFETLI
jgi:hypothetical protein